MVAACAHASNRGRFHLWGLDYNFEGASGWLIDKMLAARPGPDAHAALLQLKADDEEDDAQAKASGKFSDLFLASEKSEAEIARAKPSIDRDGGLDVQLTFAHLLTSYAIYREFLVDVAASDVMRAKLLKQNFMKAMRQVPVSERSNKVIVKFGDSHLFKGMNDHHNLNLGNYIAEAAEMEGQSSLHICVLGAGGTVSALTGYGQPTHIEADTTASEFTYRWMAPFVAAQVPGGWTLYDLRALRTQPLGPLDSGIRRMLDGYDLLVIVPGFTAAEMAD